MARRGKISFTDAAPAKPSSDADFAIYIDFCKNSDDPGRVFRAADGLIRAFQDFDKAVCRGIDSHIEPVMLLEDIESGSLKVWLRSVLQCVDNQSLKDGEWKKTVGRLLVKAKYAAIRWTNDEENLTAPAGLTGLASEITSLARATDLKYIPDYNPPSLNELAVGIQEISTAKAMLSKDDSLELVDAKERIKVRLDIMWTPETFSEILTKETIQNPEIKMILGVKKPDYIGESRWDFRHGNSTISAKIVDEQWLEDFQDKKVVVQPGDALECMVVQELQYGYDNNLLAEKYTINKVLKILVDQLREQQPLFPGPSGQLKTSK